jgi:glycosyltransferase involved in cell wall biosynthesis
VKILWHGVGPWHKTGYGVQTALFAPRLAGLGHEVVLAYMGIRGVHDKPESAHPDAAEHIRAGHWKSASLRVGGVQDIPLLGPGLTEFAPPPPREVRAAFGGHDPDLVIVMKDAWVLPPNAYKRWNTAVWTNIDCRPMGTPDREFFEISGARPIAVSKFGQAMMREAGLSPLYIPHGIDTNAWTPGDKAEARKLLGLPAPPTFIAGINASNIGPRKAWTEQLGAFAVFHAKLQPDSLLLIHASPDHPEGINLRHLAAALGIEEVVKFGAHVNMRGDQMVSWYRSLDVLLNATYGEGFGLPIVEALACRIPVIGTECSAMPEKIPPGAGQLVRCQPWWNPQHQAWWAIPDVRQLTAWLDRAEARRMVPAPEYGAAYDADLITTEYWKPALEGELA